MFFRLCKAHSPKQMQDGFGYNSVINSVIITKLQNTITVSVTRQILFAGHLLKRAHYDD